MRYIFTLLFFCAMLNATGQTSFEGKINYDVHMPGEAKPAKLILSFGTNKIKMEFIMPGKTFDNDYAIIDLNSGNVYNMNVRDKSYETRPLQKNTALSSQQGKVIMGHPTTLILQQPVKINPDDEFLSSLNNGIFYVANDLYYAIPEAYVGNPILLMVKNGKLVLGAEIELSGMSLNSTINMEGGQNKSRATVMATSIVALPLDATALAVPEGYINKSLKN